VFQDKKVPIEPEIIDVIQHCVDRRRKFKERLSRLPGEERRWQIKLFRATLAQRKREIIAKHEAEVHELIGEIEAEIAKTIANKRGLLSTILVALLRMEIRVQLRQLERQIRFDERLFRIATP
jgi:small-conductance mechanosensitive channel